MDLIFLRESSWRLLKREWLLWVSFGGLLLTSFYLHRFPLYEKRDFEIIFLLGLFFVQIKGLELAGVFRLLACKLKKGRAPQLKLLCGTFFLAAFITNDLALLITVPLFLQLRIKRPEHGLTFLAIAANAGSALTPMGNPQNLFLYWFYGVHIYHFIKEIFPFSAGLGLLIWAFGKGLLDDPPPPTSKEESPLWDPFKGFSFGFLTFFCLGLVFKVFPLYLGFLMLLASFLLEPRSFKIDYMLLLTFLMFFGFTDNLRAILKFQLHSDTQVFWAGALLSQVLSNVPTSLLLADFTSRWAALLWGVSVGGLGNIIGSLANLIVFRLYLTSHKSASKFLISFHFWGYLFFFFGAVLYFICH